MLYYGFGQPTKLTAVLMFTSLLFWAPINMFGQESDRQESDQWVGSGPYQVGSEQLRSFRNLHREAHQDMFLSVWYPEMDGGDVPAPHMRVVIYSHGFSSVKLESFELARDLASHGYVVVAPQHLHQGFFDGTRTRNPFWDILRVLQIQDSNFSDERLDNLHRWALPLIPDRVSDFLACKEYLNARNSNPGDILFGKINSSEPIGLVGFSLGGHTALQAKEITDDRNCCPSSLNVGAIVTIDGDYHPDEHRQPDQRRDTDVYDVPTMNIKTPKPHYADYSYESLAARMNTPAYLVKLESVDGEEVVEHGHFIDFLQFSEISSDVSRVRTHYTISFLNKHLVESPDFPDIFRLESTQFPFSHSFMSSNLTGGDSSD